jgi:hypothetical protein
MMDRRTFLAIATGPLTTPATSEAQQAWREATMILAPLVLSPC